jgi:hypothetical protein
MSDIYSEASLLVVEYPLSMGFSFLHSSAYIVACAFSCRFRAAIRPLFRAPEICHGSRTEANLPAA